MDLSGREAVIRGGVHAQVSAILDAVNCPAGCGYWCAGEVVVWGRTMTTVSLCTFRN